MFFRSGGIRPEWASLPLELVAGTIMFAHGLTKLPDPGAFAAAALGGIPLYLAYLVIAAELGGGLLLLAGLFVRLAALGHLCVMAVAVTMAHWATGLTGTGGFEFPLSLLAIALALLVLGADPLSIDSSAGISGHNKRAPFRRENLDVTTPGVRVVGAVLILAGAALPFARSYLGMPEGTLSLSAAIFAGLVSVASGAATVFGWPRAYIFAFILARLCLAGSALMLFWLKHTVRGTAAMALSLLLLAILRGAQRRTD